MNMKKGQGLSMNVIIIAAIALLVLVILSVLVLRAGGGINEGTGCEKAAQGVCAYSCSDITQPGNWIRTPSHNCANSEMVCCIKLGGDPQ
jgi:hypothetical protein